MDFSLQENLISTKEASKLSGYNPDYLSRLCRDGKIAGRRIGRSWLVYKDSLDAFVVAQAEHKRDIADSLAHERRVAYRAATAALADCASEEVSRHAQMETRKAVRAVMGAFARGGLPERTPIFTGYGPSAALTALILAVGVLLAGTGLTARVGAVALTGMFDARLIALESLEEAHAYAVEKRSAVLASAVASRHAHEARVEGVVTPEIAMAPEIVLVYLHRPPSDLSVSMSEHVVEESVTKEVASFAVPQKVALTDNFRSAPSSVGIKAMEIYRDIGYGVIRDVDTILDTYEYAIEVSGEAVFSLANAVRTSAQRAPSTVASAYQSGLYAYVSNAQQIPQGIVEATYLAGDSLARLVSSGVVEAPAAYDFAIHSFVGNSEALSTEIGQKSYALGSGARNTVAYVLEIQDRAIAEAVDVAGVGLAGFAKNAPHLVKNTVRTVETLGSQTVLASPLGALTTNPLVFESFEYLSQMVSDVFRGMLGERSALHRVPEYLVISSGGVSDAYVDKQIDQSRYSPGRDINRFTVSGPLGESAIEANDYIAGPYVLATSTTATSAFSGNIAVGRNADFGGTTSDLLTINGSVASHSTSSVVSVHDKGSSHRLTIGTEKKRTGATFAYDKETQGLYCLSLQTLEWRIEQGTREASDLAIKVATANPTPAPISKGSKSVFPGMEMNSLYHKKRTRKL